MRRAIRSPLVARKCAYLHKNLAKKSPLGFPPRRLLRSHGPPRRPARDWTERLRFCDRAQSMSGLSKTDAGGPKGRISSLTAPFPLRSTVPREAPLPPSKRQAPLQSAPAPGSMRLIPGSDFQEVAKPGRSAAAPARPLNPCFAAAHTRRAAVRFDAPHDKRRRGKPQGPSPPSFFPVKADRQIDIAVPR